MIYMLKGESAGITVTYRKPGIRVILQEDYISCEMERQKLAEQYSEAQARIEALEAALRYFWDLADLNSWEIGVHHRATDLVAQRVCYGCSGCDASVMRSAEKDGAALAAMNFPHGPDCMYVKLRDLAEALEKQP